jgi:hypothetical protein
MRVRIGSLIASVLVMFTASLAAAQTVAFDFDKTADFSRFKTYAWVPGTHAMDELNHKRVIIAIEDQLMAKGLAKVDASMHPDVLVAYHAGFGNDVRITATASGYRWGGIRSGSARAEQILTGALAVDIVEAATGSIVWRGVASRDVDVNASPERRDRNITKTAEKLFKHYPPPPRTR